MPDNNMRVRIHMLEEENLYKQQDLKKGNSTLIGFESLCFSCLIAPHFYRVRVTRESRMSWAHPVCCILSSRIAAITHTHTLGTLTGFRENRAHRQTNVFADNCMHVTVPWL